MLRPLLFVALYLWSKMAVSSGCEMRWWSGFGEGSVTVWWDVFVMKYVSVVFCKVFKGDVYIAGVLLLQHIPKSSRLVF
jgi:hypothetical protein